MRRSLVPAWARASLVTARVALAFWAVACGDGKTISLLGSAPRVQADSGKPDSGPGTPPKCTANTDCQAPHALCNLPSGECVQCLANEDCSTLVCNAVTHGCTGCLTNADCDPATPYCDRDDRRCVECDNASQCPAGEVCAW